MSGLRFEDVLGALALCLLLVAGLWVGAGLGLDAGADELLQVLPR